MASRIAMPHILPSTVPSVSASATFFLSWLNPPPHPITVYASHPPSPTTAQHSLPGSALPPYRGRSFTGRNASASPHAPEPKVRIHLPPAESQTNSSRKARVLGGRGRAHFSGCAKPFAPLRPGGTARELYRRRARSQLPSTAIKTSRKRGIQYH